jgi:hypothetical protein
MHALYCLIDAHNFSFAHCNAVLESRLLYAMCYVFTIDEDVEQLVAALMFVQRLIEIFNEVEGVCVCCFVLQGLFEIVDLKTNRIIKQMIEVGIDDKVDFLTNNISFDVYPLATLIHDKWFSNRFVAIVLFVTFSCFLIINAAMTMTFMTRENSQRLIGPHTNVQQIWWWVNN